MNGSRLFEFDSTGFTFSLGAVLGPGFCGYSNQRYLGDQWGRIRRGHGDRAPRESARNLQVVPISITAISAEEIRQKKNIVSPDDFQHHGARPYGCGDKFGPRPL